MRAEATAARIAAAAASKTRPAKRAKNAAASKTRPAKRAKKASAPPPLVQAFHWSAEVECAETVVCLSAQEGEVERRVELAQNHAIVTASIFEGSPPSETWVKDGVALAAAAEAAVCLGATEESVREAAAKAVAARFAKPGRVMAPKQVAKPSRRSERIAAAL